MFWFQESQRLSSLRWTWRGSLWMSSVCFFIFILRSFKIPKILVDRLPIVVQHRVDAAVEAAVDAALQAQVADQDFGVFSPSPYLPPSPSLIRFCQGRLLFRAFPSPRMRSHSCTPLVSETTRPGMSFSLAVSLACIRACESQQSYSTIFLTLLQWHCNRLGSRCP